VFLVADVDLGEEGLLPGGAFWSAFPLRAQAAASGPPTQLAPVVVQGRNTDLVGTVASASQGIVGAGGNLKRAPFFGVGSCSK